MRDKVSGIRHHSELEALKFSCQIGGMPLVTEQHLTNVFTPLQLRGLNASGIVYGCIAGMEAWNNAGFAAQSNEKRPNTGVIFGAGISGTDKFREAIHHIDDHNVRRLGSTSVLQTMTSGVSTYLGGMIAAGNQVTANSSACATGVEALLMGIERIRHGKAKVMLVGSTSDSGPYIWGGFDAMRILPSKYNQNPTQASRPMSASASGFVPGSGAGAMVIEDYEHAKARGATIYAEVLGGHINSGGQTNGGSMTAPNPSAVQECIIKSLQNTNIQPTEIDYINGHLTATTKDTEEIQNWVSALDRSGNDFPAINATKANIGHGLAASGSMECVATVLQLKYQALYPQLNCSDLHPNIKELIAPTCIPQEYTSAKIDTAIKASFGFGDVNACVIFKRFE
ncbi:beta-ketoacyl-[acyl-carrier-protein] synthase family protein [Gangjinia marincola]|uniref:3-oxoacyl-[acyl-carrier-protein] synthase 1 n=2 Tax=Gangjinia marincola TaxID=578463 RepID=A0ABN1MF49_9FLAO